MSSVDVGFSFLCGELWHDPVQCKVLKMWIKKCEDDSETSNWLAANTKVTTFNCRRLADILSLLSS